MPETCTEYAALKARCLRGWNTWNTRSVTSHVLLPEGLCISVAFKSYAHNAQLKEPLIGRKTIEQGVVRPGPHALDGAYTALELTWHDVVCRVETAHDEAQGLVMLITPLAAPLPRPALAVIEAGFLWNRPGHVARRGPADLVAAAPGSAPIGIHATRPPVEDPYIAAHGPYLAFELDAPVGLSTHRPRSLEDIRALLDRRRGATAPPGGLVGDAAEAFAALQAVMGWDTVYDPLTDRAISTVSRIWNVEARSGWGLFCWDNFFAGTLAAAAGSKEIAYSNVIEILREATPQGFVPNNSQASGRKSLDRSQPPVGSISILGLYERYGERWLLEETFPGLLKWNRWWHSARRHGALLCWGSNPFTPVVGDPRESNQQNTLLGAALESGLDNSPMYDADEVTFDPATHLMCLHDVGLNALYIADCRALARTAEVLDRAAEARELKARAESYARALETLWDDATGLYLNRRTTDGSFSRRLAPTHFYPLLAGVPEARARRMVGAHLLNPAEFWGEWVLPSIARCDAAFGDQDYWRGCVWAPMNYLVYLGLRNYAAPEIVQARQELAARSRALLLKEWRTHGHVHENYSALTGTGCNIPSRSGKTYDPHLVTAGTGPAPSSDAFYHWGALLAVIEMD